MFWGAQWSPLLGDQEVLELSPEPWLGFKQTETGRQHCRCRKCMSKRREAVKHDAKDQVLSLSLLTPSQHCFAPKLPPKIAVIIPSIILIPNHDQKQTRSSLPGCPGAASEEPRASCQSGKGSQFGGGGTGREESVLAYL